MLKMLKCLPFILADDKSGANSNNNTIYANHFIIAKTIVLKLLSNINFLNSHLLN